MPVGRGYSPSASGSAIVPGASAEGEITANAAVALLTDEAGNTKLVECSAISHGEKFYGFAKKDALDGQNVEIKTMRGSIVNPLVEDGGSITAGQPVFLSRTPGKVSGSVPAEYEFCAYGIEYTGGSASDPSSFTSPSGNTSPVTEVSGFGIPSGKSWVFRALYKSGVDGSIRFRLTSGNDSRMWWNINARPANPDLDPNKSILEIAPNPDNRPYEVFQFETDTSGMTSVPQEVLDADIRQVAAGNNFALALDADGRVYAWGDNSSGQTTVPVGAESGVTKVTAGHNFAYVLKEDGSVLGWGDSTNNRFNYTGLNNIVDLVSGWFETLFIDDTGAVHRRGSSTGVTFNVSGWSSGVTSVGVSRYVLIANQNGGAVVTGLANHQALNVPTAAQSGVVSVQSDGGSTLWATKSDGTIIGWGKADSGQMSQMHAFIQTGVLGDTVSSTYVPGANASGLLTITDPDRVIANLVPTQGYLSAIQTSSGALHAFGLGGLATMAFPTEAESGVLQAAFGGDFCVTLKPNSGSNSATTVTSEEYTINEGVTTPFVVAGGAGSLTFEWSVNGGPWQSDGSYNWLQYMTDTPVPKPVTVQVGYGVSDSSLTLITDLRVV
jgi:hypothetical protein